MVSYELAMGFSLLIVLLVAGSQTLATQLALTGDPAALSAIRETTSSQTSLALQFTAQLSTTSVLSALTATVGEHIDVICWSCTPEPAATATPGFIVVSVTPPPPSPTPQPSQPPVTRTPGPTRIPGLTPTGRIPGVTVTAAQPTATGATPTRRPATPTRTAMPLSPTVVLPVATATAATLPTPEGTKLPAGSATPIVTLPSPSAAFQLLMSSDFDPTAGIYRSTGATISWPAGEVLNFAPAVTLALPSSADSTLVYRSQVVAWSFVRSGGQLAMNMDVMGHSGCRLRAEPSPTDAVGLEGCSYRYLERPTTDDMGMQAHAFWSAGTPLDMCIDVHTYDLGQLRDTDLTLQVAIRTEAVDVATGQVLASTTEIKTSTFAIRLAVPRSTR